MHMLDNISIIFAVLFVLCFIKLAFFDSEKYFWLELAGVILSACVMLACLFWPNIFDFYTNPESEVAFVMKDRESQNELLIYQENDSQMYYIEVETEDIQNPMVRHYLDTTEVQKYINWYTKLNNINKKLLS